LNGLLFEDSIDQVKDVGVAQVLRFDFWRLDCMHVLKKMERDVGEREGGRGEGEREGEEGERWERGEKRERGEREGG
jgi:hypothetical protein